MTLMTIGLYNEPWRVLAFYSVLVQRRATWKASTGSSSREHSLSRFRRESTMNRERALKVLLVLVGLFFSAGIYPLIGSLLHPAGSDTGDTIMLSIYVALGVFLLIAVRNPSAHRSLIAFGAWSSLRPFRGDVDTGTRNREPACRISGRVGCACCHRHSVDRAGSGETASRVDTCGWCVGSHFRASHSSRVSSIRLELPPQPRRERIA
jgi:hypothetical protein